MKLIKFIFPVLAIGLLLYSCQSKWSKDAIARVDSLYLELDKSELILNEINADEVDAKQAEYKKNIGLIGEKFDDKKKTDENWLTITQYGVIKKTFKVFPERKEEITENLRKAKNQLDNLKKDLKNRKLKKEDFEIYFQGELDNALSILSYLNMVIENTKTEMHRFDSLNPLIINVIDDLDKK